MKRPHSGLFRSSALLLAAGLSAAPACHGHGSAWLWLPQLSNPDVAKSVTEVKATIDEMVKAVTAADQEAYIRHVWNGDHEFYKEHVNWAAPLDKYPVVAFAWEVVDDPAVETDDPVTRQDGRRLELTLRMRYAMGVGHAKAEKLEKGAKAVWRAAFERHDPDAAGPEPERWFYCGEVWEELHGEYDGGKFIVRFLPGDEQAAKEVLAAFPDSKKHVDAGFEVKVTRPLQIKLYKDMEHLKATVYLNMPDPILGGWNEMGESIKFMANYTDGVDAWRGALAHEYGHVATWELGPKAPGIPWWVAEGAAELAAEHFVKDARRIDTMMRRRAVQGTLVPWEEIADYQHARQQVKIMAYYQGHGIMRFVSSKWGRQKRNSWLAAMCNGKTVDEASRQVFEMSFEEVDAEWKRSLGVDP